MFFASVYCKQIQEPKPYSNETTPTMCSRDFLKTMMDNYQGDLTDILRPIGGCSPPAETPIAAAAAPEWQFPASAITFSACPIDDFGDPFVHLGDPMIHAPPPPPPPPFFHSPDDMIKASAAGEAVGFVARGKILDEEMKRPPSIFSRMLQISPTEKCESPTAAAGSPMLGASDHSLISPMSSKGNNCLMESSLQISSPRNTGIRRRKSQAKKVVCIPAPAPANSRPSGEIVPSDLWAWRKYGQKPIKGSPYPRGYYRCSSSKGCSARKQVERSRTDPNMLVITYTSEHNHPWPTQRNALAGSTRAQPSSKTAAAAAKTSPKEEACTTTENAAPPSAVKEEADREFEKMADDGEFDGQSYKPALPESAQSEESFFAGLGEIEGDSLDMLFTQGFDARVDAKGLDAFGFYDWGGGNASAAAAAGEDERES